MTTSPWGRRALISILATGVVAATGSTLSTAPAGAAPGPGDITATYQALTSTLGAIPDGPDTGGTCSTTTPAVKEIQIPVSGVSPGPITDVRVRIALEHDKVGDIGLQLVSPDGTTVPVIDRIGADRVGCGDDSGFNGNFSFFDGAPGNLAAFAAANGPAFDITSGNFFPSTAGGSPIALSAAFANVNANGTWKLRVLDYQAGVVGRVYSANIFLAHTPKSRTAACQEAKNISRVATRNANQAEKKESKVRTKLTRAKKQGSRSTQARLKAKLKKVRAASDQAGAVAQAAGAQKTAACG